MANKGNNNDKIILIENDKIVSENTKVAKMMNNHFVNIVKGPSTTGCSSSYNTMDSIEDIIVKYKDHPSILKINNNVSSVSTFSFFKVCE